MHAFGFGTDYDANSMHAISETFERTFSFIEVEGVISRCICAMHRRALECDSAGTVS